MMVRAQTWWAGLRDETGATAIEYALIASLVSVGCIVGVLRFQDSLQIL